MNRSVLILSLFAIIAWQCNTYKTTASKSVLVFSKTEGYRHQSIDNGIEMMLSLSEKYRFAVAFSENSEMFQDAVLDNYDAVIFLNTTGDILNEAQQRAFENYIENGGGLLGIHSAADTEYEWQWYGNAIGAYFLSHPDNPNVREADIDRVDHNHISTQHLPNRWHRSDEWYNYKSINPNINVLLNLDENSYEGGSNGEHHPIAWYQNIGKGRVFYTGGGHTAEAYIEEPFVEHIWGALRWVMKVK